LGVKHNYLLPQGVDNLPENKTFRKKNIQEKEINAKYDAQIRNKIKHLPKQ
jgi:hypothetical protein